MTTRSNVATITDFVAAWSRLDPDELASYFTEDGSDHNIPVWRDYFDMATFTTAMS